MFIHYHHQLNKDVTLMRKLIGHGSRLPNLPQQKSEKSRPFLESIQSSHQLENKEVHSPAEWTEKESVPVLNTDHEQDYNRIAEKQTQFRVKGKINEGSKEG